MKTSKMSLVVVLALALSLGLALASWARPMGGGMMGAMNLTPDQAGKLFDLKEKLRNDTAEVRKQMMVKHAELALWKAEKPDEKAITAKAKELNALRGQMIEKSTAFHLEARKMRRSWPSVSAMAKVATAAAWASVVAPRLAPVVALAPTGRPSKKSPFLT